MSRARKMKWVDKKPAFRSVFTTRDALRLTVIERRLLRACDLLSCLEYCQDGELNLGALAIVTRDLLDTVRTDLKPLCRQAVRP